MNKESKKTMETKFHWNCSQSIPSVNDYTINPSTGIDRGERAIGTRFHGAVSQLIMDCVD